MPYTQCYVMDR